MATTFTGHEFYSKRALKVLPAQLNFLSAFSTDLSGELIGPGKSVEVPLVKMDEAGTFVRTGENANNFARPVGDPKTVTVTIGDPIITGFAVTADQASKINKVWWEGKADLNMTSVAASASTAVTGLVTEDNFSKAVTNIGASTDFAKKGVARIASQCEKKGLRVKFSTLALSGEYFYNLLAGLDANVYGGTEAIRNGVIPGLFGFGKVMLMHGLTTPGFVCEPSAIAFASRGFRPADDKPYRAIREIKDPESGLTLTLVEYGDGPTGDLSESVTTRIGAAVGDADALVRLVAAKGADETEA